MSEQYKAQQTEKARQQPSFGDRWAEHEVINKDKVFDYGKYLDVTSGRLTDKEKQEMREEIKNCIKWCKESGQRYDQYIQMKMHFGL